MMTDGGGSQEQANRTLLPVYLLLETLPALMLTRSQMIFSSEGGVSISAAMGARTGWHPSAAAVWMAEHSSHPRRCRLSLQITARQCVGRATEGSRGVRNFSKS